MEQSLGTESARLIEATCPECRGPLTEIQHDSLKQYRCLVEHVYSPRSLLEYHGVAEEKALWAAVLALEETMNLIAAVTDQFPPEVAAHLLEQARRKREQAGKIRRIIEDLEVFRLD